MTAYRSSEEALRVRLEELDAELARVALDEAHLEHQLTKTEAQALAFEERLAEAGPGGGHRGAARDRVGLASLLLAAVGVSLVPLHIEWHRYVARDIDVLPAVLLLGVPGALGALVAWPYRRHSASCRIGAWLGVAFALGALVHVVFGRLT